LLGRSPQTRLNPFALVLKGTFASVMNPRSARWIKYLTAIIVGNVVYFVVAPYLPPAAQHRSFHPDLGTIVDFWFCVAAYGLIELLSSRFKRTRKD